MYFHKFALAALVPLALLACSSASEPESSESSVAAITIKPAPPACGVLYEPCCNTGNYLTECIGEFAPSSLGLFGSACRCEPCGGENVAACSLNGSLTNRQGCNAGLVASFQPSLYPLTLANGVGGICVPPSAVKASVTITSRQLNTAETQEIVSFTATSSPPVPFSIQVTVPGGKAINLGPYPPGASGGIEETVSVPLCTGLSEINMFSNGVQLAYTFFNPVTDFNVGCYEGQPYNNGSGSSSGGGGGGENNACQECYANCGNGCVDNGMFCFGSQNVAVATANNNNESCSIYCGSDPNQSSQCAE